MATLHGISKVCHRGESRLILIVKYSRTFLVNSIRVFMLTQSLIYHTSFLIYKYSFLQSFVGMEDELNVY